MAKWQWFEGVLFLILVFALIVLFGGEPDLMDAIIDKVRGR